MAMTSIVIDGVVEHVCPYADEADQPIMVWDITLSTEQGTLGLTFGTPRMMRLTPGDWLRVTIDGLDDVVACTPDSYQRGPIPAPDTAAAVAKHKHQAA